MTDVKRREKEFRTNIRTNSERIDFAEHSNGTIELFTLSSIYAFFSESVALKAMLGIAGKVLFPMAGLVSFLHPLFAWIGWARGHRGMVNRNWDRTSNAIFQTLKGLPLAICIFGNVIGGPLGVTVFAPVLPWVFIGTLSTTAAHSLIKGLWSAWKAWSSYKNLKMAEAKLNEAEEDGDPLLTNHWKSIKAHHTTVMNAYLTDLKWCTLAFSVTTSLCLAVAFVTFVPTIAPGFAIAAVIICGIAGLYCVYDFIKNRRDLARKQKIGPQFKEQLDKSEELANESEATVDLSNDTELQLIPENRSPLLLTPRPRLNDIAEKQSKAWHDYHDSAQHATYMSIHCRTQEEKRDYLIRVLCQKLTELIPKVGDNNLLAHALQFCNNMVPQHHYGRQNLPQINFSNQYELTTLQGSLQQNADMGVKPILKGFQYEQKKAFAQREKHNAKFRVCLWILQTLCKEPEAQVPCFRTETDEEVTKRGYNKVLGDTPLRHIIAKDILMADENRPHLNKTKTKCTQSFFRAESDTKKIMEATELYFYPERFPQFQPNAYDKAKQSTPSTRVAIRCC